MSSRALIIGSLLLVAVAARAERDDPTAHLNAERDTLIEKIAHGQDLETSVRRFGEMVKERDGKIATTQAAQDQEKATRDKERADREARSKVRDEYRKTLDYEVSWRCTLSPDPANPVPSTEGRFRPDWGKVVRKEKIRLAPKNELDEGDPATLYEVKGVARSYTFMGEKLGPKHEEITANVGDLMLVCFSSEGSQKGMPANWGPKVLHGGFVAPIKQPPLIVKKSKWNPIHITGSAFFWAVKDVKWKFPPGSFVLSHIEILKELAPGQWEIAGDQDKTWVMEVPASLRNRDLLKPYAEVWAILGSQRFDKGLRKLVLVAEDLESRYVQER